MARYSFHLVLIARAGQKRSLSPSNRESRRFTTKSTRRPPLKEDTPSPVWWPLINSTYFVSRVQVNSSLENEHYEHFQRSRVLLSALVTSPSARVAISLATVTIRRISTGWHYPIFDLLARGFSVTMLLPQELSVPAGLRLSCIHQTLTIAFAWMKRTDPSFPIKSKRMVLPAREGFSQKQADASTACATTQ